MPSSNPLPPKENALFKRILRCYEQKQYKNGLKFAKQILSNPKFHEHGETMAMKGLTLNSLGRKEEAYDHVRKGLRTDLKSHVCWHVYGLLQRSDKKYDEAIKCYRNALRWDSENLQILRDLSLLQIQMRDLDGYKETRYRLFEIRPNQRASWIGLAISYHLLAEYVKAVEILERFFNAFQKSDNDYEHSELLLYQNMVIAESGNYQGALEHLEKYNSQICDKVSLLESKGNYLIQANRLAEAERAYRDLINRNPEHHMYYNQLAVAAAVEFDAERKLQLLNEVKAKYPKAQAPKRLALDFTEGETFKELVEQYMQSSLTKGIPPLFIDLKPLYKDPAKARTIYEICERLLSNLNNFQAYSKDSEPEPPTTILWLYYFLGQHYDFLQDYEKAFAIVDKAIEHTPTLIELFLLKGKIFKHVGDMESAVNCVEEAQSLDTADRYINCKCAKYMLRASKVSQAEEMCQKFTREGVSAMESLNEMQCMWFQTECAFAFQRMGKFGDALKKCLEIDRHFTEITEDQFDFHTYCLRKMTLRSYIELLRLEDVLRSHRFFIKTAACAISIYIGLFDKPLKKEEILSEIDTESMDPSELKKLRNKMKKAEKKAEQQKANQNIASQRKDQHFKSHRNKDASEEFDSQSKDDLVPDKLERPEDPLAEAMKFLTPLQQLASNSIDTHFFAFEIYYRKGRALLMLQSIKRALKLKTEDPRLHSCLVRFQLFFEKNVTELPGPVKDVILTQGQEVFKFKSSHERNAEFMQMHKGSLEHRVIGAKMQALLDPTRTDQAVKTLICLDGATPSSLKVCCEVYDSLISGEFGAQGKNVAPAYQQACQSIFKYASKFKPSMKSSKEANDKEIKEEDIEP